MILKKYSPNYEGGKCPVGFEYVNGYMEKGVWVDSYCRKIKRYRTDPYEKEKQKDKEEEDKIHHRIYRRVLENESPYADGEETL
jgi:hypothetical protein